MFQPLFWYYYAIWFPCGPLKVVHQVENNWTRNILMKTNICHAVPTTGWWHAEWVIPYTFVFITIYAWLASISCCKCSNIFAANWTFRAALLDFVRLSWILWISSSIDTLRSNQRWWAHVSVSTIRCIQPERYYLLGQGLSVYSVT